MFFGLTPLDRIQIALACAKGDLEFHRELRRANRAAGTKKNNKDANPVSDIGNAAATTSDNSAPIVGEHDAEKPTPTVVKQEKSAEKVRTEQDIKAEAESPAEEPGAEKINGQTTAVNNAEAAMAGGTRIGDDQPGVLDFSAFGDIKIDLRNTGTEPVIPNHDTKQQFPITPMPDMNTYGNMINNFNPVANQIIAGQGRHRVDLPKTEKPPKPPKAKPEMIETGGMPNVINAMDVQPHLQKMDVRTYGVLGDNVSKTSEVVNASDPVSIFPNNATLYPQYSYLQDVEKIALSNGYQIAFRLRNTGMIDCFVCNQNGQPINDKGFVIDPGFIIDQRRKIFVGIYEFYEGMNAYPLYISGEVKDGKKSANVLNVDLIKNLIVAGNHIVDGAKGMYTPDFIGLNCIIPLITIPTNKIGRSDRKYIQSRLVDLYKDGTLSNIAAQYPNSRFRIAQYNKDDNTIILDTDRTPKNFGCKQCSPERVQIKITKDKCKILRGENIINNIPDPE